MVGFGSNSDEELHFSESESEPQMVDQMMQLRKGKTLPARQPQVAKDKETENQIEIEEDAIPQQTKILLHALMEQTCLLALVRPACANYSTSRFMTLSPPLPPLPMPYGQSEDLCPAANSGVLSNCSRVASLRLPIAGKPTKPIHFSVYVVLAFFFVCSRWSEKSQIQ